MDTKKPWEHPKIQTILSIMNGKIEKMTNTTEEEIQCRLDNLRTMQDHQ